MSSRPDAWMPLYIGDYLKNTSRLTTEAHGAYLLLIFDYWVSGKPLPDDDQLLAAITRLSPARWKAIRKIVAPFFQVHDGEWHHKRIDEELVAATELVGKRSIAGKEGAAARWGKRRGKRIANACDSQCQTDGNGNAPSPSPSQSITPNPAERGSFENQNGESTPRANGTNPRAQGTNPRAKASDTVHETPWDRRCSSWAMSGFWRDIWGPKPDETNCLAPGDLADRARQQRAAMAGAGGTA